MSLLRHSWRLLQASADSGAASRCCRSFSEAASTSGRPGATPASGFAGSSNGASAGGAAGSSGAGGPPGTHIGGTSRLFENIKPIASEQVTATHEAPSQPGAAMRALSSAGNAALLGFLGAGAFFGYYTVRYNAEELQTVVHETRKPENQFLGSAVWVPIMEWYLENRMHLESEVKKYQDPPSEALLPPLPPQASHVRTLVLDLDDLLVHSDWTRGRGWRTFKRPGAEDFLKQMAQLYEIVVYTHALPTYADPILDRLDPSRYIVYRLYRDSTLYQHGHHVRDLSKLNRDMSKVLFVTSDPKACKLHPNNAVLLKPWKLEADDHTLLDLMPFLEAIYRANVPDVRNVVQSYEGQNIPVAFRERMKQVAEQQQQQKAKRGFLKSIIRPQ
ncbi:hypothetical protein ABBQ38_003887 [Trebouxia sp. C0009 RCD-2024]